jgi:hypothetical protein
MDSHAVLALDVDQPVSVETIVSRRFRSSRIVASRPALNHPKGIRQGRANVGSHWAVNSAPTPPATRLGLGQGPDPGPLLSCLDTTSSTAANSMALRCTSMENPMQTDMHRLARDVSDAISTPEQFQAFAFALADLLRENASELQHAHQDRSAGRCWHRAAALLDRAAESVVR